MLIIEGTDQLGKTTLCKKLLKDLSNHIFASFTRLPARFNYLTDYMHRASVRVVQDRFHMSEIAYAYARGESSTMLTPERYRLVDAYLRLNACSFTVILYTSHDLSERWEDREEMYSVSVAARANDAFKQIAQHGHFKYGKHLYSPDVDITIDLRADYIDDDFVEQILIDYQKRCDQYDYLKETCRDRITW
jgi:thymidylate kinase